MKYDACTDEELIERLRQGETEITDYILDCLRPSGIFVWTKTAVFFILQGCVFTVSCILQ